MEISYLCRTLEQAEILSANPRKSILLPNITE